MLLSVVFFLMATNVNAQYPNEMLNEKYCHDLYSKGLDNKLVCRNIKANKSHNPAGADLAALAPRALNTTRYWAKAIIHL